MPALGQPKLTPKQYAAEGGTRCPRCLSHDIEGGFVEIDEGGAAQPLTCHECGAEWEDYYTLIGYRMEEP